MIVLGVDPGFKATGLVWFTDEGPRLYFTVWAENEGKGLPRFEAERAKLAAICRAAQSLIDLAGGTPDALAIEYPDWHQGLRGGDWVQKYARERDTQVTQALIRGALTTYFELHYPRTRVEVRGVNQWHRSFGARNKALVAEACAGEFPETLERRFVSGGWQVFWRGGDHPLPDHITDAIGLARVVHAELTKALRINDLQFAPARGGRRVPVDAVAARVTRRGRRKKSDGG